MDLTRTAPLRAALFDMDGLLIDSEPYWREAEIIAFGRVGLTLTDALCRTTMGLRVDDVVEHWYRISPWPDVSKAEVERRIIEECTRIIGERGEPMRGVPSAIDLVAGRGLRMAVVSSSPTTLIAAVLDRLGISGAFELLQSAEDEPYGKPHPGVYLSAARTLGVAPTSCLAIEDSVTGVIAAKAGRMRCIAVPEPALRDDPRFSIADLTLDSLDDLSSEQLDLLGA